MSDNRVALVTGGSRGIGRAITSALAERGWDIVVNYRENAEAASEAVREIEAGGTRALAIQADVSERKDREDLVTAALGQFGRIDLLVNNAGMARRKRTDILQATEESFNEVMSVNLKGPYFLTQRVAVAMIDLVKQGVVTAPKIVNIGSISAYTSSPGRGEYCLSKAALAMMTRLYAHRLAEYGINVYEVRPGVIDTDMTAAVRARYDHLIAEGLTPIARWGKPEDVAKAIVALAEGYLPFSTGEVINVDGGFHLARL